MTSTFEPKPLHSEKPPWTMPSISTRNLKFLNGSTGLDMEILLSFYCLTCNLTSGNLLDAEDDEFSRAHDCHADFGHDLPEVADGGRIGRLVAADKESLLRRQPEQRARVILIRQKIAYRTDNALPERRRVRLKDDELCPLVD